MKPSSDLAHNLMQSFIQLNRQRMHSSPVVNLKHSELFVLRNIFNLDQGQGIKVSELSSELKVSAPSITQTVNGLVKKGLVTRTTDTADRRAVRLVVTSEGEEKLTAAFEEFKSQFQGLVNYLGEEKSVQLKDLLQEVYQYFESLE